MRRRHHNAIHHHATSQQATQHREVTRRTVTNRALTSLCLALVLLCTLNSCYDYREETFNVPQSSTIPLAFSVGHTQVHTRLSDAAIQLDENLNTFRGIDELALLPFHTNSNNATAPVSESLSCLGPIIGASNSIGEKDTDLEDNFSKYYNNVVIPYSTNAFLCYGSGPSTNAKTDGKVIAHNLTSPNPSNISFSLQPITTVETVTAENSKGQRLVAFLNGIYEAGSNWPSTNTILSSIRDDFFSAKNTAGSSANVLAMTMKLYNALKFAENNTAVKPVTDYIKTKINVNTGKWSDTNLDGYPTNLNLPDGAAYISWNTTSNKYELATDKSNSSALAVYSVENVVYPPSLYYYANSLIHTSTVEVGTGTGQRTPESIFVTNHTAGWQKNEATATPDNTYVLDQPKATGSNEFLFKEKGTVNHETTVVAITKPLQYAISRLDFKLRNGGTMTDGKLVLKDANDTPITIEENTFPVTGILIAGQKDVDWKFQPVNTADATEYTIYDSDGINANLPAVNYIANDATTESAVMRTLAFETAANKEVYAAVEFLNNSGQDFVTGTDKRIVPNGCKFYLIGKLDPAAQTGVSNLIDGKVFVQDHVTTIAFTVSSLANAYNVIPDFSAPTLEFSLGVLDWKLSTPASISLE